MRRREHDHAGRHGEEKDGDQIGDDQRDHSRDVRLDLVGRDQCQQRDDWQRRGLGRKLLANLLSAAKRRGVRRVVGTALSTNSGMLALARRLRFRLALHPASATITTLTLDLETL